MNTHSRTQRLFTCVLLVATLGFVPDVPADGRSVNPPMDTTPVYDIPFARGISIDGDGADWKEAGFRVEFMPDKSRAIRVKQEQNKCQFPLLTQVQCGWIARRVARLR